MSAGSGSYLCLHQDLRGLNYMLNNEKRKDVGNENDEFLDNSQKHAGV